MVFDTLLCIYDIFHNRFFMHMEELSQLQKIKVNGRGRSNNKNTSICERKKQIDQWNRIKISDIFFFEELM